MKTALKPIIAALVIIVAGFGHAFGAIHATQNALTGEVMYKDHFKLNANITESQAFTMVQKWFTENPEKFTRGNNEQQLITTKNLVNREVVEQAFKNDTPLQQIDQGSNWVAGTTTVKYYGGELSSIWLMYIEYYVIVEVKGNELTATISHIKYHHYNPVNYAPQAISNAQGTPFKPADGIETLSAGNSANQDLNNLNDFLTRDIAQLLNNLKQNITGEKALTASK
jgi:hypothetical protein